MSATPLFDTFRLGDLTLPNRIVMAPLTRNRAAAGFVPSELAPQYYSMRADAGLLITEASQISQQGQGYQDTPGIYTDAQIEGWKKVTDAVHAKGGRIFIQLWHVGRVSHTSLQPNGGAPVAPSALTAATKTFVNNGFAETSAPRALELSEIAGIVEDYRRAAANAIKAGFDGVEVHGANGYLIDQFLKDGANQRTDAYGGSIENRARLLRQVTEAVAGEIGADRTGVRLSPNGESQGVNDPDPVPLFRHAAKLLSEIGIAFLELREPPADGTRGKPDHPPVHPEIRAVFDGRLVLNSDFDGARAAAALETGAADAIAFGRGFLANPDLPARIRRGIPLAPDQMETWYTQGPEGYIDYPTADAALLDEALEESFPASDPVATGDFR